MEIINLILIQIIIVFLIDVCKAYKFPTAIFNYLFLTKKFEGFEMKPLSCSLCMTHWMGLIYILIIGFTIKYYAIVCLLAFFTPVTLNILYFISDNLLKLTNKRL